MSDQATASVKPPKKKRRKGWIIFVIILIPVLAFIGLQAQKLMAGEASGKNAGDEEMTKEEISYAVNTTFVRAGTMEEYLNINGDITAANTVDAYPDTAGKLVSLIVDVGDNVAKDEIIAWVDPSRPGMNFEQSPVKAPINGTVTAVMSKVGSMAAPQIPIVTIGDLAQLQARAHIPERFTSRISLWMPAELTFETFPDRIFTAKVSEISPVVDPASRSMEIKMDLYGPRGGVKAGMFAEIQLVIETKENVIRVPSSTVVNRFGDSYVFTMNSDDTAALTPVKTGITVDGVAEIIEGLEADQEIIYQGMNQLGDGSRVRIIEQFEILQ